MSIIIFCIEHEYTAYINDIFAEKRLQGHVNAFIYLKPWPGEFVADRDQKLRVS